MTDDNSCESLSLSLSLSLSGKKDCPVLHDKMKKAIDASISSTGQQQELVVFIVEVEHLEDVQKFGVRFTITSLLF